MGYQTGIGQVVREVSELERSTLENIGKNVRYTRRKLLNVTLNELAANTGVSRDVICRLEALANGENIETTTTYPSISTVIKFCEGVGVTPAELLEKDFTLDTDMQYRILEHCKEFSHADLGKPEDITGIEEKEKGESENSLWESLDNFDVEQ